jgi:hypothetical protein
MGLNGQLLTFQSLAGHVSDTPKALGLEEGRRSWPMPKFGSSSTPVEEGLRLGLREVADIAKTNQKDGRNSPIGTVS